MFRITSIILTLALAFQLNAQSLLLFEDDFELGSIPGLQLLVLPNRDLAGGVPANVSDYSGNGNTGSFEGSMELNQTANVKYFVYDGTDDYVDFGRINFTDKLTIGIAFKTNHLGTIQVPISQYDFGNNQRAVLITQQSSGELDYTESGDGVNFASYSIGAGQYNNNAVYMLFIVKDGTTIKSWINMVSITPTLDSGTPVTSLHNSTASWLLGARLNNGTPQNFFEDRTGFTFLSSEALTEGQLNQIYYSPEIQSIIGGM